MQITDAQQDQIRQLLEDGRKIEAIKYIRQEFGANLRQAKRLVDQLETQLQREERLEITEQMTDNLKRGGSLATGCIGSIFGFIGLGMLIGTIIIIYYNEQLVSNGIAVTATVTVDPYQPTFEYELYGQIYQYESSTYSDPPSYELGETVEMYVNPNDAEDVLINTFSERWLGPTILGVFGIVFSGVGFIVGILVRRMIGRK